MSPVDVLIKAWRPRGSTWREWSCGRGGDWGEEEEEVEEEKEEKGREIVSTSVGESRSMRINWGGRAAGGLREEEEEEEEGKGCPVQARRRTLFVQLSAKSVEGRVNCTCPRVKIGD